MEDGLDDLFGDVGDVGDVEDVGDDQSLHLPEPLPKGLLQRVDEIALSGCCQYVANFQRLSFVMSKN